MGWVPWVLLRSTVTPMDVVGGTGVVYRRSEGLLGLVQWSRLRLCGGTGLFDAVLICVLMGFRVSLKLPLCVVLLVLHARVSTVSGSKRHRVSCGVIQSMVVLIRRVATRATKVVDVRSVGREVRRSTETGRCVLRRLLGVVHTLGKVRCVIAVGLCKMGNRPCHGSSVVLLLLGVEGDRLVFEHRLGKVLWGLTTFLVVTLGVATLIVADLLTLVFVVMRSLAIRELLLLVLLVLVMMVVLLL